MSIKDLNLLDLLLKNEAIATKVRVDGWKDAVYKSLQPLIRNNVVTEDYYDAVLKSTSKFGPYYIIDDKVAMPHASSEVGVNDNGFSLITLEEPVVFPNDDREIHIIISLAATSSEIHVSKSLPQIVAIFEDSTVRDKIIDAENTDEIAEIISQVKLDKYLK